MSIIFALIIFSAIVLFHELGHFLLAKRGGIAVTEFSLGMGPRLLSHEWGGTLYSLKLFPFGGSCLMLGEDPEEKNSKDVWPARQSREIPGADDEHSFQMASVWTRISVVAAGPIFNFILAYLMAMIIVAGVGYDSTVINVIPGSAAEAAGMEDGDQITSIGGSHTFLYREVSLYSTLHQGQTTEVTYKRDGESYKVTLTPLQSENGAYLYGFSKSAYRDKGNVVQVLGYSAAEVRYWMKATVESLSMLVRGQVGLNEMSGPVGIVDAIGETYQESRPDGWFYVAMNLLMMAILLSVNLGVMNLLPIPALDGGRLVFLIIEAIRGKALPAEKESMVHFLGFAFLMGLMVLILFNDVYKIFLR